MFDNDSDGFKTGAIVAVVIFIFLSILALISIGGDAIFGEGAGNWIVFAIFGILFLICIIALIAMRDK